VRAGRGIFIRKYVPHVPPPTLIRGNISRYYLEEKMCQGEEKKRKIQRKKEERQNKNGKLKLKGKTNEKGAKIKPKKRLREE
jgi:hypothetical protein